MAFNAFEGFGGFGGDVASKYFFGNGSDGDLILTTPGTTNLTAANVNSFVVKQYNNINIGAGCILTTDIACKGLVLYAMGNVTISGEITMTKKGPYGTTEIYVPTFNLLVGKGGAGAMGKVPATVLFGGSGGNGGAGGNYTSSSGGGPGGVGSTRKLLTGAYGGGGGGGESSGGAGSGIGNAEDTNYGPGASPYTCPESVGGGGRAGSPGSNGGGGSGYIGQSAGWTGNHVGATSNARGGHRYGAGGGGSGSVLNGSWSEGMWVGGFDGNNPGGDGEPVGGFLVIICKGNLTINAGGKISADGGKGGNGGGGARNSSNAGSAAGGGGGGGAGGGVILLAYKGTYTNNGSVTVAGGAGGSGGGGAGYYSGSSGGSGGVGAINLVQIT